MKEIIATLATQLGDPSITVAALQKWRQRKYVPYKHQLPLLDLAERKGVDLDRRDLDWRPKAKRARAA